jgi:hypothetical protein
VAILIKEFNQRGTDTVRAQAALIPAVHIVSSELTAIKQVLTRFYIEPTESNFNEVVIKYNKDFLTNEDRGRAIAESLYKTVAGFSLALGDVLITRKVGAVKR